MSSSDYSKRKKWDKDYDIEELDIEKVPFGKAFFSIGTKPLPKDIKMQLQEPFYNLQMAEFTMRCNANAENELEKSISDIFFRKEIYIPWKKFLEDSPFPVTVSRPKEKAYRLAIWHGMNSRKEFSVEKFNKYNPIAKAFMARDMYIYLGRNLNEKLKFIILYTECGTTEFTEDTDFDKIKNISFYIYLQRLYGYTIYNFGSEQSLKEFKQMTELELKAHKKKLEEEEKKSDKE